LPLVIISSSPFRAEAPSGYGARRGLAPLVGRRHFGDHFRALRIPCGLSRPGRPSATSHTSNDRATAKVRSPRSRRCISSTVTQTGEHRLQLEAKGRRGLCSRLGPEANIDELTRGGEPLVPPLAREPPEDLNDGRPAGLGACGLRHDLGAEVSGRGLFRADRSAPTASPTIAPDEPAKKVKVGPKPTAPKLLPTRGTPVRVGATCRDGSGSDATGRGACSWHGGVRAWLYEQPSWVYDNKETNAKRTRAYNAAVKAWKKNTARNRLLADYPCTKGPYPEGSSGYASWRDTNDNGIACDR